MNSKSLVERLFTSFGKFFVVIVILVFSIIYLCFFFQISPEKWDGTHIKFAYASGFVILSITTWAVGRENIASATVAFNNVFNNKK
jgi:hypothetical protein